MKLVIILLSLSCSVLSFSQIESGKKNVKREKREIKVGADSLDPTANLIYLAYGTGSSYRMLKPNGDFYGEALGERAKEYQITTGNFNLGVKTQLQNKLQLDLGIGFIQYGEAYNQTINDTNIRYQNTYSHICTPIKIKYAIGRKVQFFVGTGLQAQMFYGFKHDETISSGKFSSNTVDKSSKNMNFFTLSSCSDLGIQYAFKGLLRLFLAADFYYQLNSSYLNQEPYIHKPFQFGGKFGVGLAF